MKRTIISGAVLALAVAGMGTGQAGEGLKVTGGGQAFTQADADSGVKGPGDTYGFNAQAVEGPEDAARGQFNSIQRTAGAETAKGRSEHIKGEVTCLTALATEEGSDSDGVARFGGFVRGEELDENGDTDPLLFSVQVTDDGEGSGTEDTIVYQSFRQSELDEDENACDMEPMHELDEIVLARGNVQIHNYTAPEE